MCVRRCSVWVHRWVVKIPPLTRPLRVLIPHDPPTSDSRGADRAHRRARIVRAKACVLVTIACFIAATVLAEEIVYPAHDAGARPHVRHSVHTFDSNTTVLLFASSGQEEVLLNWLATALTARGTLSDIAIVCVDDPIGEWLAARGGRCSERLKLPAPPEPFWRRRAGTRCNETYHAREATPRCEGACANDTMCAAYQYSARSGVCSLCRKGVRFVPDMEVTAASRVNVGHVFIARIGLLLEYLKRGRNVVLSDLDALWVQDPHEVAAIDADVVAQRGSHPRPLHKAWGATLCMGFSYFRANARVVALIESVREGVALTGDDQEALNAALHTRGVAWQRRLDYTESTVLDRGAAGGLSVALLPHHRYLRICGEAVPRNTVVAHCYDRGVLKTDAAQKTARARRRGLWVLADDWRGRPVKPSLDAYVASVREHTHAATVRRGA